MNLGMFDRFTDSARKAMEFSWRSAQRFKNDYIGPEHMLLGLLKVEDCGAWDLLDHAHIDRTALRDSVESRMRPGTAKVKLGQLPFPPAAKRVLEAAYEEASSAGLDYIGSEHLLLGLRRTEGTIAHAALEAVQVDLANMRARVSEFDRQKLTVRVRLLGFGDEAFPAEHKDAVRTILEEHEVRITKNEAAELTIAFAPERNAMRMFAVGVARGRWRTVILLHLPGESFKIESCIPIELGPDLPKSLPAIINKLR